MASFGCILKVGPTRFADRFGYGKYKEKRIKDESIDLDLSNQRHGIAIY